MNDYVVIWFEDGQAKFVAFSKHEDAMAFVKGLPETMPTVRFQVGDTACICTKEQLFKATVAVLAGSSREELRCFKELVVQEGLGLLI